MAEYIDREATIDAQSAKMTEFQKGYEQGYKDGMASAALPNVIDNGDKIDGYNYAYKTDSRGEPYIHIDSVRNMLTKAADVQSVVHCKDCKHRKERHYEESGKTSYIKYECKFTKYSMSDNGFCSFGKRTNSKRTRNLTDKETEIYNSKIESESKLTGVKIK